MTKTNKKGFTIIEVVLVLAIAGLIFLMVFIALPALQRSQRNTRRRSDMALFLSAVNDYQSNHGGKAPSTYAGWYSAQSISESNVDPEFVKRYIDSTCDSGTHNSALTAQTSQSISYSFNCTGDQFRDPDGSVYSLTFGNAQPMGYTEDSEATPRWIDYPSMQRDHIVYLATDSKCTGNESSPLQRTGGSANNVAIVYVLEGGAIYCGDNQ